jgi:hypothetical protein
VNERTAAHDRRQRRMLVALALLFFAPLFVSFYLYYGHGGWHPGGRVNHGDLVVPPRPLPDISLPLAVSTATVSAGSAAAAGRDTLGETDTPGSANPGGAANSAGATDTARTSPDFLKNKWTLLYWGAGSCSARCRTDLYNTRQVRVALDRDMDRVQRVYVAEGECCDWAYLSAQHPDLITLRATPDAAPLLALLPHFNGIKPLDADRIYVIDPLGNLMMSYAPDAKPKGMLEDLKRLLGLSHVG